MTLTTLKTPGLYIKELNAFPKTIVPVVTAISARIGYTANAEYQGKSILSTPHSLSVSVG